MSKRVAIFGGSFNPPHIGHVLAAVYVLATTDIDELWIVPCFIHPFAKTLASYEDRYRMCELGFGWIPRVVISDVERRLGGASRTLRTLQHLQSEQPSWSLRMVVGSDVLTDAPRWHGFDQVAQIAPLIVLPRLGAEHEQKANMFLPDVSSTFVRKALAAGQIDVVREMVPRDVFSYALGRKLYEANGP